MHRALHHKAAAERRHAKLDLNTLLAGSLPAETSQSMLVLLHLDNDARKRMIEGHRRIGNMHQVFQNVREFDLCARRHKHRHSA